MRGTLTATRRRDQARRTTMLAFLLGTALAAGLGSLHFTATGPRACQSNAREGLLLLHSFVYDEARTAFQKAGKAAPCPIAFWGEAMTYDHPLWNQEDLVKSKAALTRMPPNTRTSPQETALIEAAKALFGEGDAKARHEAWRESLRKSHASLPNDDEVSLFYALSLIATAEGDVKQQMEAVVLAQEVFQRVPDHPGAAHYLIHAADSPMHAVLALKAARKYAQIAPLASHALHMPSHIFVQLGMWRDVEMSNIAAYAAAKEMHPFTWLAAARLELGKPQLVLPMLQSLRDDKDPRHKQAYEEIASMWFASTQAWPRLDEIFGKLDQPGELELETRLRAAAEQGDEALVKELSAKVTRNDERTKLLLAARQSEAHSLRDAGSLNDATAAMRALADFEDREAPSGPPYVTPAREELGDLLMRTHRYREAEKEFRAALYLRPNRLNALRGLREAELGAGELASASATQAQIALQVQ
jgi:tetratricopeptide (TPR) repeat protein